jgi:hypothetical protein
VTLLGPVEGGRRRDPPSGSRSWRQAEADEASSSLLTAAAAFLTIIACLLHSLSLLLSRADYYSYYMSFMSASVQTAFTDTTAPHIFKFELDSSYQMRFGIDGNTMSTTYDNYQLWTNYASYSNMRMTYGGSYYWCA